MMFERSDAFLPPVSRSAANTSRRRFLATLAALPCAALPLLSASPLVAQQQEDATSPKSSPASPTGKGAAPQLEFPRTQPGPALRQATLHVAAAGDLKINADGQKVTKRPVQVTGEFAYDEALAADSIPVRHYTKSQAQIVVGKTTFDSQLADSHRTLALHRDGEQAILYSPLGPLTRDELELLQVPGAGAALEELLPEAPVALGDSWKIPDTVLARLLWLDAVSSCEVTATLKSIDKQVAIITLTGNVSGAVGGIATEIDLQAKLNYDVDAQFVTWLALAIQENRSIGHAAPGFETKSQVKIAVRALASSPHLSDDYLAKLPLEFQPGNALLQYESPEGRFRTLLDRRWRLMVNRHDLTVLRLVDRGDLLAQCNLSRLPALAPGKQLPLEELQDDIKNSLGKNFRQFVEASQSVTDEGLRILRVTVVGESSDIAVQWNYYHVSNDKGQRMALVFTFESSLLDRFADVDRPLVAALQFLDDPAPTSAKPDGAKPESVKTDSVKTDSATRDGVKSEAAKSSVPKATATSAKPTRSVQKK